MFLFVIVNNNAFTLFQQIFNRQVKRIKLKKRKDSKAFLRVDVIVISNLIHLYLYILDFLKIQSRTQCEIKQNIPTVTH